MNSTNIKVISEEIQRLKDKVHAIDVEVPDPSQATDGQILSVDNGKYVIADPEKELPATTGASAGDVLGLVGETKEKEWITPYKPKDYLTNEVDLEVKWVDGKEIYRKSWSGVSPVSGNMQINIGVVDKIISIRGTHGQTNGRYYDFNYDFRTSYYDIAAGIFYLIASTNEQFQNVPIELVFEYTKPEPTLTKKKTTKKGE